VKTRTSIALNIGLALFLLNGGLSLRSQSEPGTTASAPKASAHVGEAYQQRVFDTPSDNQRRWSNNVLISFRQYEEGQKETILLYDQDGKISRETTVSLPDAEVIALFDTTLDNSGSLFASGGTQDTKGRFAHFIAQLNESGQVSRVVRTTPFMARQLCVAKNDGTIWAYGGDQDMKGSPVLEQYSLDNGLLKALFPRTMLDTAWSLLDGHTPDQIHLACNDQKVVVFNATSNVLLEYDLASDKAIRRPVTALPGHRDLLVTGFCMTKDGLILASLYQKTSKPPMSGVFQLNFDDSRGVWVPLEETVRPGDPNDHFRIVGTNGTDVIYSRSFEDRALSWARLTH
jgi:hypothetical protein